MATTATQSFRDKIGALAPDQSVQYVNILVYGDPGVGKTRFAGTAGAGKLTGPILFADIDGGTITVRKMPGIDVKQIRTIAEFEKLVNDLANDSTNYYKTFAVDSVTELQKLDMRTVMLQTKENAKNPDNIDVDVPSPREWGKALSLDTIIPTPDGFKTIEQIQPGDRVFSEGGSPINVTAVSLIQYGRKCFRVTFDDGQEIVADAEHQWLTWDKKEREAIYGRGRKDIAPKVRTTEEILGTLSIYGESNHSIRVAEPLQFDERELPLDPYILGVWLGDGNARDGMITTDDLGISTNIQDLGWETRWQENTVSALRVVGLTTKLQEIGLIHNKHVPDMYLTGSIKTRQSLLEGLMDSDGHSGVNGQVEFSNKNHELVTAVHWLCCSLGHKSRIFSKIINGEKYWRVRFVASSSVFRLERKKLVQACARPQGQRRWFRYIRKVEEIESVPVKCLVVDNPSHLFLAGLGCIPTHNSGEHIRRICRAARDLKMHTIFTALEAQETDDQTDITRYYPSIPGKLKNELSGFFDIVGRLEAKNVPNKPGEVMRKLQTAKTTKVAAKDRFDCLPMIMDEPTIPAIWDLINA